MSITELIIEKVKKLPKPSQVEVLDFVEFIDTKLHRELNESECADYSINNAMRGLESEDDNVYSLSDIKEKYS